jgi:hypothetical protein
MQMRVCKDWVFGYSVCDVAHPRRTSSIHLAAEGPRQAPASPCHTTPYFVKDRHDYYSYAQHSNMIQIDMSFCMYHFRNTAFL